MQTSDIISTAEFIEVSAFVRYWEDAKVNGIRDNDGTLIYGREQDGQDDVWHIRINLAEGRIQGWPEGDTADIHYKVCDAGLYWLLDADGQRIAKWSGHYVPSAFLCHGDSGYGDYIIFNVDEGGIIKEYSRPDVDPEMWTAL